jgi:hypothetical protein
MLLMRYKYPLYDLRDEYKEKRLIHLYSYILINSRFYLMQLYYKINRLP